MAKDDRFTVIVVVLVTLITAGAFLWSHWGSLAISLRPTAVAAAPATTVSPEPAQATAETGEENTVVPALYEIDPAAAEAVMHASYGKGNSVEKAMATLEMIASGWTNPTVPAPAEILVRRDRDGRTVVASGTHRRYEDLRQNVQNLVLSDIDSALLQADGTSSSAEVESLRANLIAILDETLAVDVPDTEPDMVAGVHAWQFADTEYRSLSPAQKHLLLMGRDNARAVRAKLVEIRRHLGEPDSIDTDQPAIRTEPVVIAQSFGSEDPVDELIEP